MNCMSIMGAPTALLLVGFLTYPALAYHSHHRHHHDRSSYQALRDRIAAYNRSDRCALTNDGRRICGEAAQALQPRRLEARRARVTVVVDSGTIIGSRPAGCPHAYCGCGLRKHLGLTDTRLNLARNWARLFPHEGSPRAGLAAVRNHHVMYIEASAADGMWLVRDYNSGGGLSRIHIRGVHGYVFVNPHSQIANR